MMRDRNIECYIGSVCLYATATSAHQKAMARHLMSTYLCTMIGECGMNWVMVVDASFIANIACAEHGNAIDATLAAVRRFYNEQDARALRIGR